MITKGAEIDRSPFSFIVLPLLRKIDSHCRVVHSVGKVHFYACVEPELFRGF